MVLFICCSIMLFLNDATSLWNENELVAYIKKFKKADIFSASDLFHVNIVWCWCIHNLIAVLQIH